MSYASLVNLAWS